MPSWLGRAVLCRWGVPVILLLQKQAWHEMVPPVQMGHLCWVSSLPWTRAPRLQMPWTVSPAGTDDPKKTAAAALLSLAGNAENDAAIAGRGSGPTCGAGTQWYGQSEEVAAGALLSLAYRVENTAAMAGANAQGLLTKLSKP